jgi:hypothetical protein
MLTYIHLRPDGLLPDIQHMPPYKAVVLIEDAASPDWQDRLSHWLVSSGCRYMLAQGERCSEWEDAVDWAAIDKLGTGQMPEAEFVVTACHSDETVGEIFSFAKQMVYHPAHELNDMLILHISSGEANEALLEQYRRA